jgi:hypothetical protein
VSSRRRLAPLYAGYCAAVFALVFGLAEFGLRARGETPWRPAPPGLRVDPGGRLYQADPALGYRMLPGRYTVRLENGRAFHVTHGADTLRVTAPASEPRVGVPALWIFGCSFSYGWGVDDESVYAWQLRERLPGWRIVNHSVNGYGTLQSLLQLESALEAEEAPAVVVLAYAAFHDERNTFVRARRKRVAPFSALGPLVQPFAWLDAEGVLHFEMADVEYREWPGMRRSALVHVAEQQWNVLERRRARSAEVTRALVRRFVERAAASGARVIVAGIAGDTVRVLEQAASLGATPLVLALDLDRPGMRNPPPDAHPSPLAHRQYAARLVQAVRRLDLAP